MMNPFKRLRYKNKLSTTSELTQQEVADMLGITKGAVSKIEKNGNANMDTLRRYHKAFNVPYDYLMGETATENPRYHALGEIFPFDDAFYGNLEKLLGLDMGNHSVEYMLSALLDDPQALFAALTTIFNTLYQINHIQQDKGLSASTKTEMLKMHEYIFSQSTVEYLEDAIMPLLSRAFEKEEERLGIEALETEEMLQGLDDGIEVTVSQNGTLTPAKNNHE